MKNLESSLWMPSQGSLADGAQNRIAQMEHTAKSQIVGLDLPIQAGRTSFDLLRCAFKMIELPRGHDPFDTARNGCEEQFKCSHRNPFTITESIDDYSDVLTYAKVPSTSRW